MSRFNRWGGAFVAHFARESISSRVHSQVVAGFVSCCFICSLDFSLVCQKRNGNKENTATMTRPVNGAGTEGAPPAAPHRSARSASLDRKRAPGVVVASWRQRPASSSATLVALTSDAIAARLLQSHGSLKKKQTKENQLKVSGRVSDQVRLNWDPEIGPDATKTVRGKIVEWRRTRIFEQLFRQSSSSGWNGILDRWRPPPPYFSLFLFAHPLLSAWPTFALRQNAPFGIFPARSHSAGSMRNCAPLLYENVRRPFHSSTTHCLRSLYVVPGPFHSNIVYLNWVWIGFHSPPFATAILVASQIRWNGIQPKFFKSVRSPSNSE